MVVVAMAANDEHRSCTTAYNKCGRGAIAPNRCRESKTVRGRLLRMCAKMAINFVFHEPTNSQRLNQLLSSCSVLARDVNQLEPAYLLNIFTLPASCANKMSSGKNKRRTMPNNLARVRNFYHTLAVVVFRVLNILSSPCARMPSPNLTAQASLILKFNPSGCLSYVFIRNVINRLKLSFGRLVSISSS